VTSSERVAVVVAVDSDEQDLVMTQLTGVNHWRTEYLHVSPTHSPATAHSFRILGNDSHTHIRLLFISMHISFVLFSPGSVDVADVG